MFTTYDVIYLLHRMQMQGQYIILIHQVLSISLFHLPYVMIVVRLQLI